MWTLPSTLVCIGMDEWLSVSSGSILQSNVTSVFHIPLKYTVSLPTASHGKYSGMQLMLIFLWFLLNSSNSILLCWWITGGQEAGLPLFCSCHLRFCSNKSFPSLALLTKRHVSHTQIWAEGLWCLGLLLLFLIKLFEMTVGKKMTTVYMTEVIKLNLWLPGNWKAKASTLPFGCLHHLEILHYITLYFYAVESFPCALQFPESLGQKSPGTAI